MFFYGFVGVVFCQSGNDGCGGGTGVRGGGVCRGRGMVFLDY